MEKGCCSNPWHQNIDSILCMTNDYRRETCSVSNHILYFIKLDVLDRMLLALASGQAGQVLIRQLFCRPNLNYVELKIIATSSIIPEKPTQGNTASRFALFTAIPVHSVAVRSLVTMKPMI